MKALMLFLLNVVFVLSNHSPQECLPLNFELIDIKCSQLKGSYYIVNDEDTYNNLFINNGQLYSYKCGGYIPPSIDFEHYTLIKLSGATGGSKPEFKISVCKDITTNKIYAELNIYPTSIERNLQHVIKWILIEKSHPDNIVANIKEIR
jgi:hypothetical protein